MGCGPWGPKELNMTERLTLSLSFIRILAICQVVKHYHFVISLVLPPGTLHFYVIYGFSWFSYVLLMHGNINSMGVHLPIER